jgi:hypothetical protein
LVLLDGKAAEAEASKGWRRHLEQIPAQARRGRVKYQASAETVQARMAYHFRDQNASKLLLQAGVDDYERARDHGKLGEWRKAMLSIIELVADEKPLPI